MEAKREGEGGGGDPGRDGVQTDIKIRLEETHRAAPTTPPFHRHSARTSVFSFRSSYHPSGPVYLFVDVVCELLLPFRTVGAVQGEGGTHARTYTRTHTPHGRRTRQSEGATDSFHGEADVGIHATRQKRNYKSTP